MPISQLWVKSFFAFYRQTKIPKIFGDIVKSLTLSPTQPTLLTPHIEDLLNVAGTALSTPHPSSIWLSLSTSLINRSKIIADEQPQKRDLYVGIILQLITAAWTSISKTLTNELQMQEQPDITSTFFGLLTMLTKSLPVAFLQLDGALLEGLLTFSTVALKIPERHALRAAADFVASTIFQTRNLPPVEQSIVDGLLKKYGAVMVRTSLIGVAHNAPRSQVPILGEIIFLFVIKLSAQSERWIESAVLEPLDVYARASMQDKEKLVKTINAWVRSRYVCFTLTQHSKCTHCETRQRGVQRVCRYMPRHARISIRDGSVGSIEKSIIKKVCM